MLRLFLQKYRYCTLAKPKWDIVTAVCIERKPVVVPEMNSLELAYWNYLERVDYEKSYRSDHELRLEADRVLKTSQQLDIDQEVAIQMTAEDFEEASENELKSFRFAERTTSTESDQRSIDRKLDKHLILLIQQQLGTKNYFLLPQAKHMAGETLRDTAERTVKECCGETIESKIYGNAPVGFYKYEYPKRVRESTGSRGAKIFFYFARYCGTGNVRTKTDHLWLDYDEMCKILPARYCHSVSQFAMLDDRNLDKETF